MYRVALTHWFERELRERHRHIRAFEQPAPWGKDDAPECVQSTTPQIPCAPQSCVPFPAEAKKWVDRACSRLHTIHMKRTNLVLDADLLEQARSVSGARTYSDAVNQALAEFVRLARFRGILELQGTGAWQGDLSQMRRDGKGRRKARA